MAIKTAPRAAPRVKTRPYDSATYLTTDKTRRMYLEEAFATSDPAFIAAALGTVARAHGMTDIASSTGLGRESLYKSLSADGNPELTTLLKVIGALGLRLSVERAAKTE